MSLSRESMERISAWAKRMKIPQERLQASLGSYIRQVQKSYPSLPQDKVETRARALLYTQIKSELLSTAVGFVGMILGCDAIRDIVVPLRNAAINMYNTDPQKAVELGFVDAQGKPLDARKELGGRPNRRFGLPLPEHIYVRQAVGVLKPVSGGAFKPTRINIAGPSIQQPIPLGVPMNTRLNIRQAEGSVYVCNAAVITKFESTDHIEGFPTSAFDVIDKFLGPWFKPLGEVQDFIKATEKDPRRVCLTEGTINRDPMGPTKVGSYIFVIDDESLEPFDKEGTAQFGITVFAPEHLKEFVNFGRDSSVQVIGRPRMAPSWDRETRQPIRDKLRPVIDAYGVYCRPEFRMEPGEFAPSAGAEAEAVEA